MINNLLYEYQLGFQKAESTDTALIFLVDEVSEALAKEHVLFRGLLTFLMHLILLITIYYYRKWNFMAFKVQLNTYVYNRVTNRKL